jgi:hypothetical protein
MRSNDLDFKWRNNVDRKKVPNEINRAESQLNRYFESVEPDPEFAGRLENQLIQVARSQPSKRKSLAHRVGLNRFSLNSVGQWGITLVGIGLLVIALVYGFNRLIPPARIPNTSPSDNTPLAATHIPTMQPTGVLTATVTFENPIPTPSEVSQVAINAENDATSVNLRSCPSVTCAVVGEMFMGQQVQAIGIVSDGSWIQVVYPGSPEGTAWVYGELVTVSGDLPPVVRVLLTPKPSLPAIAPQACKPAMPIKTLLGYLPEHPTQLINGGFVQSGDFIFEILLGCDSLFGPNAEEGNLYSDIPNLGAHLVLSYRGKAEKGQIVDTWGVGGAGVPALMEGTGNSSSGIIAPGIATQLTGLRIPPDLLASLSRPEGVPLEFVYQARNPEEEWTGAALSFTLVNKPDGFYVTDTNIQPLSAQELSSRKPQSFTGPVKVGDMTFTPAGDTILLARTTDIQSIQDGIEKILFTWPEPIADLLADFSADGSVLAARLNYNDVALVGLPDGEIVRTLRLGVNFIEWPMSLALSPDGSQVAVAAGENTVQMWDVKSERLLTTLTQPGSGVTYQDLTFSADGATLLGGFLNTITRWDIATGEATTIEPGCRGDAIFDLAYSPDGKHVAIACGPLQSPIGFLIIWDVVNNRPVFQREEILQIQHVAFSPDGKWLATGGPDGNIIFWDVTGNREPVTVQSQATPVYDLAFSPETKELVYATEGGLVFIDFDEISLP